MCVMIVSRHRSGCRASTEKGDVMSLTAPSEFPVAETPIDAADMSSETLPMETAETLHAPLSPAATALIAAAALALSVVCATLLLTFASTGLEPLTAPDGPAIGAFLGL